MLRKCQLSLRKNVDATKVSAADTANVTHGVKVLIVDAAKVLIGVLSKVSQGVECRYVAKSNVAANLIAHLGHCL